MRGFPREPQTLTVPRLCVCVHITSSWGFLGVYISKAVKHLGHHLWFLLGFFALFVIITSCCLLTSKRSPLLHLEHVHIWIFKVRQSGDLRHNVQHTIKSIISFLFPPVSFSFWIRALVFLPWFRSVSYFHPSHWLVLIELEWLMPRSLWWCAMIDGGWKMGSESTFYHSHSSNRSCRDSVRLCSITDALNFHQDFHKRSFLFSFSPRAG